MLRTLFNRVLFALFTNKEQRAKWEESRNWQKSAEMVLANRGLTWEDVGVSIQESELPAKPACMLPPDAKAPR